MWGKKRNVKGVNSTAEVNMHNVCCFNIIQQIFPDFWCISYPAFFCRYRCNKDM